MTRQEWFKRYPWWSREYEFCKYTPKSEATRKRKRDAERERAKRNNDPTEVNLERFMHHRKNNLISKRRRAAKSKKLEFTITPKNMAWPEYCPVLGIKLDYLSRKRLLPNMPTIDRVDTRLGYTPENSRIISWRANALKNAGTPRELRLILDYVTRVLSESSQAALDSVSPRGQNSL